MQSRFLGISGWSRETLLNAAKRETFRPRAMNDLRSQNPGIHPEVQRSLALAERGDAVFVVTGQQAGLFTGPIYTIYKAITVSHLVGHLRRNGVPAVGLFWIAGEDHDLAEVSSVAMTAAGRKTKTLSLQKDSAAPHPVSQVILGDEIVEIITLVQDALPQTKRTPVILKWLGECYHSEADFGLSFRGLMQKLFARRGLLFFDPMATDRDALMGEFLQMMPHKRHEIHHRAARFNQELVRMGFRPQVDVHPQRCCLFYLHPEKGRRRIVEPSPGIFHVDSTDITWSEEELLERFRVEPGIFSTDVIMRPILQDFIFPTAIYVAGPAELIYHAQIRDLYSLWEIQPPVIWPRCSVTILGPAVLRKMERLEMKDVDVFADKKTTLNEIFEKQGVLDSIEGFKEKREAVEDALGYMLASLELFPEPLVRSAESTGGKVRGLLNKLEDRVFRQIKKNNEELVSMLENVLVEALPAGGLQERSINILPFLALSGHEFLNSLTEAVDPFCIMHHLISVKEW